MTTAEIILIAGMTAVTFFPRYLPMLVVGRVPLPDRLFRALRYVPVAVLTAISVPEAMVREGGVRVDVGNAYFYASIASVLIAWRFQNLLYTIVGGMGVFFLWRMIFGVS
ncbi:MAG: AzlD domain-containing protein [Chloroflexota bacterium]